MARPALRAGRRDAKGFLNPTSGSARTATTDDPAEVTRPKCITMLAATVEQALTPRESKGVPCEGCNGSGYNLSQLHGNEPEDCDWCGGAGVVYR